MDPDYSFEFKHPFVELSLDDKGADRSLNALFFPVSEQAKGIVLYFHGNADNLQRWGTYTVDFTQNQYEVLAVEYPGYGKNPGTPTEAELYKSAQLAYERARELYPADQIIIYGRSLGSGPASWLAAQHQARQLILETPFPSIPKLFRMRASVVLVPFEPNPKFPVARHLQSVSYPISIIQGTNDWVVPYRVASELRKYLKPDDQFITIEGGGHRNLRSFPEYEKILADLLQ
ncbi:alpha/beta hydrolase [Flavilitoribacter nigricans]|uniref:alpha/beta hydrolase n=1 Tax=Flavilitoribacter nigricans TaxID=70997 RepID=UPI0014754FA0|nr:alpha/beta fold hydrolase [Flavilitoribacter nigricans]